MLRGVGSDGRGKAQWWLGVQKGKSTIFVEGRGDVSAFIRPVASADNMTIKCRMTGFGLKGPGDGMAASFY